jgi:hypothetical protein
MPLAQSTQKGSSQSMQNWQNSQQQRHQLDEIEGALDDMLERISSVEQEAAAAAN